MSTKKVPRVEKETEFPKDRIPPKATGPDEDRLPPSEGGPIMPEDTADLTLAKPDEDEEVEEPGVALPVVSPSDGPFKEGQVPSGASEPLTGEQAAELNRKHGFEGGDDEAK